MEVTVDVSPVVECREWSGVKFRAADKLGCNVLRVSCASLVSCEQNFSAIPACGNNQACHGLNLLNQPIIKNQTLAGIAAWPKFINR